jgi:transposase
VRAAEPRRLGHDGYEPVLKKTRWCVLKRRANLTKHRQFRPRDLPRYNLQTVRAYLLKEDFQQFWTTTRQARPESSWMSGAARSCDHALRR